MYIYHNSRKIEYRSSFGAVPTESEVRFSVLADCAPDRLWLRLWNDGEQLIPMEKSGDNFYSAEMQMPDEPCLLWYYFVAEKDGKRFFCCRGQKGESQCLEFCNEASWQITVYDKNFKTPDWFKNSVMYQIFPDRFFRKGQNSEILGRKSEYILHEDWYEPVFFNRHPHENGPACNDFYGGNLKGIMEKLPYLKNLGIGVIYLNPVFEAFSNHRYDTGNYENIDPILGTQEDFEELCKMCDKEGIRIILDGVFSHTGSDSVYFNKYGNYGDNNGAYRDWNSEYRSWFQWNDTGYESWWGCSNLPNVNELEPTYIDYILAGRDAIIKTWLRSGASGWRLDVADELPDEFIKILRREVKSEKADAVIIGEVWEDASNKESYGKRREYLLGHELDSVMNYPFKDNVIAFLNGEIDAECFDERLMTIAEHYPKESLYSAMNLLGTHDTVRVKNVLSGQCIDYNMTAEQKSAFRLEAKSETLAIRRLKLAVFMQMTFVGVPCIYYGDEIGMQGLGDPFNRMPYTWRSVDEDLRAFCKRMISARNSTDCLRTGEFETVYAQGDVYAYVRKISEKTDVFGNKAKNGTAACVVNRGAVDAEVTFDLSSDCELLGFISGKKVNFKKGENKVEIPAFGAEMYLNR